MLKKFLNPAKTRSIKIFKEIITDNGTIKEYIHPLNTTIKAFVRQLSANEMATADAIQDASDIEFTIHKRNIDVGMFVEFNNSTYQISGVDFREFYKADITFRANHVNTKDYDETRWSDENS